MFNIRLLTLISALTYVAVGITAPLVSLYLQSLGADLQQISLILTSVVATSLIASTLWGRLSDRLKRRKPLLITGLFILALAFFFLSRAANPSYAWASRIFEGTGSAAVSTLSLAMMGDLLQNSPNRGRQMGLFRGLASAAFALGSVSGGWLADHMGTPVSLVLCASIYLVAALVAFALQEQPISATAAAPSGTSASAQTTPTIEKSARLSTKSQYKGAPNFMNLTQGLPLLFMVGIILWIAAHTASASMWPNYMTTLGYTKTQNGLLWGFAALIEFPAMWFSGMLSDRWGRPALLTVGGLGISLTNFGYFALAGFFPVLLVIQIMRGIGFGSYTSNAMTFAAELGDPEQRGSRSGLYNSVSSAGSLIGSLLGGTLAQRLGFGPLYALCATSALLAGICFLSLHRRRKAMV
ncbi:MAG: MFS transporter [Caldilineaceae bacterium]